MTEPRTREEAFLVRVAELLHAYGTPANRLERLLARMATNLDLRAQVLSTPTAILVAFGEGSEQRTHMRRVEPGEVDLGKLVEFDETLERLEDGDRDLAWAEERIEALAAAPPRHGAVATTVAFGAASAGAAVLFGGGPGEAAAAFGVGLVLGLLVRLTAGRTEGARLGELGAAFVAALVSVLLAAVWPIDGRVVTLAGLIVLVPGLALTVAMVELATRHLVSGTARLMGALTSFLSIALGVALGRAVGAALVGELPALEPVGPSAWASVAAIALSPIAFLVLLRARWSELPWVLAASVAGVLSARMGGAWLRPELGPFAGALVVGLVANTFARLRDRPASVPQTPGILMLVPGAIGYRALDLFLEHDVLLGMEAAFQVAIVATALVGGLLVANALLAPRRSL